jgi:hypothetical protein
VWDRSDVWRARKAGVDPIAKLSVAQPVVEPVGNIIPLPVSARTEDADSDATATATSS